MEGGDKINFSSRYFVFPPAKPKYFFLKNTYSLFKKSLFFYRPIGFKSAIKKRALTFSYPLLSFHGIRTVSLEHFLEAYNLHRIRDVTESTYRWGGIYKPPGDDKLIIQLLDGKENIVAYMKVGLSDKGNSKIKREAKVLAFLKEAGFTGFEFPEVLERGNENGMEFVILNSPALIQAPRKIPLNSVLPGLNELFYLRKKEEKLKETSHVKDILARVEKTSYPEEILGKLREIIAEVGNAVIPVGCLHFDFKLWNTFINQDTGKFFVIDWEFFREEGLPMWDIFTFVIQPLLLVKHYGKPAKQLASKIKRYYPVFEIEMRKSGLEKKLLSPLLSLYFVDMATFLEHYGHNDERTSKIAEKMVEILKHIRINNA